MHNGGGKRNGEKERRVSSIARGMVQHVLGPLSPFSSKTTIECSSCSVFNTFSRLSSADSITRIHVTLPRGAFQGKEKKRREGRRKGRQEKGSRLLIYVVVPVKRRWTSINREHRWGGWRAIEQACDHPNRQLGWTREKNRVLIILCSAIHSSICAPLVALEIFL